MTKLELSHVGPIMKRLGSLGKTIKLGKMKAAGEEEDPMGDGLTPCKKPGAESLGAG